MRFVSHLRLCLQLGNFAARPPPACYLLGARPPTPCARKRPNGPPHQRTYTCAGGRARQGHSQAGGLHLGHPGTSAHQQHRRAGGCGATSRRPRGPHATRTDLAAQPPPQSAAAVTRAAAFWRAGVWPPPPPPPPPTNPYALPPAHTRHAPYATLTPQAARPLPSCTYATTGPSWPASLSPPACCGCWLRWSRSTFFASTRSCAPSGWRPCSSRCEEVGGGVEGCGLVGGGGGGGRF